MNSKTQFYVELSNQATKDVTASVESWLSFLSTAANCHRYSYSDQLMIHAQRPGATACTEFEVWRDVMNRFVYKGEKGIALIDDSGDYPRLRYVFDVSQTGERAYSREVKLFTPEEAQTQAVKDRVASVFQLRDTLSFETMLVAAAEKVTEDYWDTHGEEFLDIVAGSTFRGYDEIDAEESFKNAVQNSVAYQLLYRCTGDGRGYFHLSEFQEIPFFNTRATVNALGTAVNRVAGDIFLEIGEAIREQQAQIVQSAERSDYGDDIQRGRDSDVTGSRDERIGEENTREIREDAEALSAGAQTDDLREHETGRDTVPASVGSAGDGDEQVRPDDEGTAEEIAGTGQDDRSDGMGAAHEHAEGTGGGSDSDGTRLQLNPVSEFEQLNLFQATRQAAGSETSPAAFSLPEDDLDNDLLRGSQFGGGKMRIYALYQHEPAAKVRADFLKKEYGLGGHSFQLMNGESGFVDYSGRGVLIHSFRSDYQERFTWAEAEKRLKRLIDAGVYLNDRDREEWALLEEKYAAVGGVPYPDPAFRMKEPEEILAEREGREPEMQEEEIPDELSEEIEVVTGEVIEDYQVGDVITLEGTDFIVDEVRERDISMRDPRLLYPLFRVETRENLKRLIEEERVRQLPVTAAGEIAQPEEEAKPEMSVGDVYDDPGAGYTVVTSVEDGSDTVGVQIFRDRELTELTGGGGAWKEHIARLEYIGRVGDLRGDREIIYPEGMRDESDEELLQPEEEVVLHDIVIDLRPKELREEPETKPEPEAQEEETKTQQDRTTAHSEDRELVEKLLSNPETLALLKSLAKAL